MKLERRSVAQPAAMDGEGRVFNGHAALYNTPAYIGPAKRGFNEQIAPGAFDRILKSGANVRSVFNHDPSKLLGTTAAGTLRLTSDDCGLHQETDLPNTQTGDEVRELTRRGDIAGQSFGFTVGRDTWTSMPGGHGELRTILEFSELIDVGPVTFPAYDSTTASVRAVRMAHPETRDGVADTGVGEMSKATDAAIDAAIEAAGAGNIAQTLDLLSAAAVTIDQVSYGLWAVDSELLTSLGLPDITALVQAVDSAIDAAIASLASGATDPTLLEAAGTAVDAVLAALHLDDPDENPADFQPAPDMGADNSDNRAQTPVDIHAGRLRLARFSRGEG